LKTEDTLIEEDRNAEHRREREIDVAAATVGHPIELISCSARVDQ
jgi:hypothetical protein